MIQSLLTELLGDMRRLAGAMIVLLAVVYVSGFLIVNLYMGGIGAVRMEIVQARFVSAGMLYIFIVSISGLFCLFSLVPAIELMNLVKEIWHDQPLANLEVWSITQRVIRGHDDAPYRLLERGISVLRSTKPLKYILTLVTLALMALAFPGLFLLLELMASWVMALLLSWAGDSLAADLMRQLHLLAQLEGLSAAFVLALWLQRNHLHRFAQRIIAVAVAVMVFSTQFYCLMWFANRLYSELPRSIGGGKAELVRFIARPDGAQALKELAIPLGLLADDNDIVKTQVVRLVDQTTGPGPAISYLVLPCSWGHSCQTVEFESTLVVGLVYCTSEQCP